MINRNVHVLRGEIYWMPNRLDKGISGHETRPALVIGLPLDGDTYENIRVVYLTRKEVETNVTIETIISNSRYGAKAQSCEGSIAICDRIFTFRKDEIQDMTAYIGRASDADMERIDEALMKTIGLEYGAVLESREEIVPLADALKPYRAEVDGKTINVVMDYEGENYELRKALKEAQEDLEEARKECDKYKDINDWLLEKMTAK